MTQPVQLQLSGASHHNQRLFSDHYLDHILPKHWDSLRDEASQVMTQLQQLYTRFTPNINNEAQTEDDWIKPVLRVMGHTFEVQAWLKTPDGAKRPDYFFYRDNGGVCIAPRNGALGFNEVSGQGLASVPAALCSSLREHDGG